MTNQLYCGDCLDIVTHKLEPVDLIYLDPPFHSNRNYFTSDGKLAFSDMWNNTDENLSIKINNLPIDLKLFITSISNKTLKNYLVYMMERLTALHLILKPTGSIYLHTDPHTSAYLKIIMDYIFGDKNFRNWIVWSYNKWTNAAKYFQRNHDVILFYTRSDNYTFNKQYWSTKHKEHVLSRGWDTNKIGGKRQLIVYDAEKAKAQITNPKYDRVIYRDNRPLGVAMSDVWSDIQFLGSNSKERTGYPTQKPLELLKRIIKTSSNEFDIVLDPFCGSGTTLVAAKELGREYIGIDIAYQAIQLVDERLNYSDYD